MELHEYTSCDAIGLRGLLRPGDVTAAEVEEVARDALAAADAEVNGLAPPLFSAPACCGLVGLKPSRGRVSCGPSADFALTRTLRDAAHLLDAVHVAAPPPRGLYADELEVGPGTLRVGVWTEAWSGAPVDPEVAAAAVRAARMLEDLGHVADVSQAVPWSRRAVSSRHRDDTDAMADSRQG